jgi:LAGLIDADG DNA endonuclease family
MNNKKRLTKAQKEQLKLTGIQIEIIHGSMLGDLHAEKRNTNGNTRLQFRYSSISTEFVKFLFSIFSGFTGSPPINLHHYDARENKKQTYSSIKFQTLSLPCFNIFRELYYNSLGLKIVPSNISELLTTRGLAHWFMDDGYKSTNGFYFCTESFSPDDLQLLIDMLTNKFNLDCSLHKHTNGSRIYIKKILLLISLI